MPVNRKTSEKRPLFCSPPSRGEKERGGHNGVKMEVETDDGY
jgi:hypothetical protein